jgi:hypothetical protein
MNHEKQRAVEMTGRWKAWKTKPRFSTLPTAPWKSLRDSHIPTTPATSPLFLCSKASRPRGFAPGRYRVVVVDREK